MSVSDELSRLGTLHQQGVLSDAEFVRAKARVIDDGAQTVAPPLAFARLNAFRRARADRWIGGVCAGMSVASGLAAWFWRLTFTLLVLCGGTGALLYLLLWILVPTENEPASMRGPSASTS